MPGVTLNDYKEKLLEGTPSISSCPAGPPPTPLSERSSMSFYTRLDAEESMSYYTMLRELQDDSTAVEDGPFPSPCGLTIDFRQCHV